MSNRTRTRPSRTRTLNELSLRLNRSVVDFHRVKGYMVPRKIFLDIPRTIWINPLESN